jgi:hypothetical protein
MSRGARSLRASCALHERGAVLEAQDRALAAQRLGDRGSSSPRVKEAGRVELVELHVPDLGARAVRHGHAVAGRDVRVGRVEVDLPCAAGREDRGPREHGAHRRTGPLVEHVRADADVRAAEAREHDQIDRHVVLDEADVRVSLHLRQQRALDLRARGVRGVHDAPRGVAAFPSEGDARLVAVEARAPGHQRAHAVGPLAHAHVHGDLVAEPRPRDERVGLVGLGGVPLREHRRDAPLRVARVALGAIALGDDQHLAVLGGGQREREPGDAAADDEEVCLREHSLGP